MSDTPIEKRREEHQWFVVFTHRTAVMARQLHRALHDMGFRGSHIYRDDEHIIDQQCSKERAIELLKRVDHMRTCRSMKHEDVWQSLFEDVRRFLADEEGT